MWAWRALILGTLLFCPVTVGALDHPSPPCGVPAQPSYASPGGPPNVRVFSGAAAGVRWAPPACTGWKDHGFRVLVALAGSVRTDGGADGLLRRFGAISEFQGIRYWSASDKRWRVLITDASALDDPDATRRRRDFTAAEMRSYKELYFMQDDSRSSGKIVYRMRVRENGPTRLVIEIDNVTPIRVLLMTLFHPGDLQFVYFLERQAPDIWGIYSLSRTREGSNILSGGHEASYVSRAVAFYRFIAGIPSDQNPPVFPPS